MRLWWAAVAYWSATWAYIVNTGCVHFSRVIEGAQISGKQTEGHDSVYWLTGGVGEMLRVRQKCQGLPELRANVFKRFADCYKLWCGWGGLMVKYEILRNAICQNYKRSSWTRGPWRPISIEVCARCMIAHVLMFLHVLIYTSWYFFVDAAFLLKL